MVYDESHILAGGNEMKKRYAAILICICGLGLAGCGKSQEVTEQQMTLRSQGMEQALAGDYESAIASYNEALSLAGMRAGALELDIASYKASAQYHAGDTQGAVDTCTAVLDLKKSAEMYLTRGLIYKAAGDTEAANADFQTAKDMTSSKDLITLGRLSYYMEDYNGAKNYLEQAYKNGNQESLYWQGELYWQMGNKDYAVTLYQNYLEEHTDRPDIYVKVASYQADQGDYESALSTIQDGIALGDSDSLQDLLGYEIAVYEQMGDFETAKVKMESYLESYPEDEDAAREYIFLKTR